MALVASLQLEGDFGSGSIRRIVLPCYYVDGDIEIDGCGWASCIIGYRKSDHEGWGWGIFKTGCEGARGRFVVGIDLGVSLHDSSVYELDEL